jgi:hypothetical protein
MARTAISAKKIVGTPIRKQLQGKISHRKAPTKSLAKTPKKRATSSRKPPPIRIIPYPTTSMKMTEITRLSDNCYHLEKRDEFYRVVHMSARGGKQRTMGYVPKQ